MPYRIKFSDVLVQRPEDYPREPNPIPPANPPKFVTFKILNKQFPRFMQRDPQSFHARFYGPFEVSSRFHPREDEDVDTSLPWHMPLEDDASIESNGEASRQEYISPKRKDEAELEAMRY